MHGPTAPRRRRAARAAVAAGLTATVSAAAPTARASAADEPPTAAVSGDADFAVDLYRRTMPAGGANLVLSPYSVRTALAMTATGAAGATARQMATALHLPAADATSPDRLAAAFAVQQRSLANATGDGCRLDAANGVWAQAGVPFRPAFTARLADAFGAEAKSVDFTASPEAARVQINAWVAGKTAGKIADLLPPNAIKPDTGMVLANAVHFKGEWDTPFVKGRTGDGPFHLDPSHDATVKMMRGTAGPMPVFQSDAVSAVALPYKGGGLSMVVVIPKAVDGLAAVEQRLTGDDVRRWVGGLRSVRASVALPRFTARTRAGLNGPLMAMGMADAFDGHRADFSGLLDPATDGRRPFIGDVFHQAFVAVDEAGTEAAAATGVRMGVMAVRARPVEPTLELLADHPFLYLLLDARTGGVLFIGRCGDPRPA